MTGHFGPGVIGQDQHEAEQRIIDRGEDKFGPGVLGHDPTPPPPPGIPEPPPAPAESDNDLTTPTGGQAPAFLTLSVNALEAELESNPSEADRLMHLEFARPGGPRKGSLRAFLAAEKRRPEPRAEALAALESALAGSAE